MDEIGETVFELFADVVNLSYFYSEFVVGFVFGLN